MGSSLHHQALIHDQHLVGIADGAETVGDDEAGAAREEFFQSLLDD